MKRRTLLVTGTASLLIVGGLSAKLMHSDLRKAQAPWQVSDKTFSDPRIMALSYAILAPSPHNRQPWLVKLVGNNSLTLYCDTDRLLPQTDPFNRQITIGLGAFVEVLRMAAAQGGHALEIDYFPKGESQPILDNRPLADIRFVKTTTTPDPLFVHVLDRRTNRVKFTETPVEPETLNTLAAAIKSDSKTQYGFSQKQDDVASIKSICVEGWNIEITTPRTHHESTRLTRVGESKINALPDGISLSGPMMEALGLAGQLSEEKLNDTESQAFIGTQKFYTDLIETARAFAWIITADNSRRSQLEAGADWLRLHLAATHASLAFQPLSQVLQEFPEMSEPYAQIHSLLGVKTPRVIQGLFRLGYASAPPPSPRWPLESRLVEVSP